MYRRIESKDSFKLVKRSPADQSYIIETQNAHFHMPIISFRALQICCTDQIFFQSSTNRPFYASGRRGSSACGIPTLLTLSMFTVE